MPFFSRVSPFCAAVTAAETAIVNTALFIAVITTFVPWQLTAQPASDTTASSFILEDVLDFSDDDQPFDEETHAELQLLLSQPIDLNTCTSAALAKIPFIDPSLAAAVIALRETAGLFRNVDELNKIAQLSSPEFEFIRPFLTVSAPSTANSDNNLSYTLIQGYSRRLDLPDGFHLKPEEGGFLGAPSAIIHKDLSRS